MKKTFLISLLVAAQFVVLAQQPLTYQMNDDEKARIGEIGLGFRSTAAPVGPVMNIAEFQPSQGVLVRYPLGIPYTLIAQMSQLVPVTTAVSSNSQANSVRSLYQSNGVNMSNVNFVIGATDSYWTRDYGPWFIIDGNDEFGVVDFIYNRPRHNDDAHMQTMAEFLGINFYAMDMEHTGGNYMTDGYGTAASTSLVLEENSSMTEQEIREMAHDYLGIDNYLITSDPLGDYIAHIDCWGKFIGVDKVMIAQLPTSDSRYQDYEDVANFFANTTTPWGNKYRVYRVFEPGGSIATPYTNCLILNDHVFLPVAGTYNSQSYDEDAVITYQNAMPGYTIVPITQATMTPWENTDALHCRTHEISDLGMLLIRHYPILGAQPYQSSFTLRTDINAYSGQSLVSDSLLVYYRITEPNQTAGNWQTTTLVPVGGKTFEATISGIEDTCQVEYYIFAKDQSNRREKHPYIGAYDPHIFTVGHNPDLGGGGDDDDDTDTTDLISNYSHINFQVMPNPAHDCFRATASNGKTLTVFNSNGQLVATQSFNGQKTISVDCSSWRAGTYFVRVENNYGSVKQVKVVVY